ncbi:MAG: type IV pilus modification protein PilV [Nevskiaceae bacterium]|nr:MAG: type IV pilus modification protein PilV [Nevskiaceae bacterium]TBR74806.1 MAG: type IV pilus modification protein PilV [Nevskiaceae bacterium]
MKPFPHMGHRQRGAGLIEILIAVLVLAIGILGIAGLQTRALVGAGDSMGRSMATVALYSIVDAMTADVANARGGAYNGQVAANACPPATGATFAASQLGLWCTALQTNLGADATTTGNIECSSTGACTVTINWVDAHTEAAATSAQTLTTNVQLEDGT